MDGSVLSAHRDGALIDALLGKVKACALCRPLLFCVEGLQAYLEAIRTVFRTPIPTRKSGRPRLRAWDDLCIAQVIKQCVQRWLVGIERRVVQSTLAQIESLLRQIQGGGQVNVAYIERLKAAFRAHGGLGTLWAGVARRPGGSAPSYVPGGRGLQLVHLSQKLADADLSAW